MAEWRSPLLPPEGGVPPEAGRGVSLVDESHLQKWRTWDDPGEVDGLVLSVSPGEWIVVGDRPPGDDVVDITHVRAALRLTRPDAAGVLVHLCALDLGDLPDGAAVRTLVAGVATEIARDDLDGVPSYVLLMSRSFARSLQERLTEIT